MIKIEDVFTTKVMENRTEQAVDGRLLWEYLGMNMKNISRDLPKAIENAMLDYGSDYTILRLEERLNRGIGGKEPTQYIFTADSAKELAMMSNREIGKEIRKYFIEQDKMKNNLEMSDVEKFQTMLDQAKQIEQLQITAQTQEQEYLRKVNQGYKAQYNKRTKQITNIKSIVGATTQKDIIPTIEKLKRKSDKLDELKKRHKLKKQMKFYTVTELSKQLNISSIKLNKLLSQAGLQYKEDGKWLVTKDGSVYATTKTYTNGGFETSYLVWDDKVLNILK